MALGHHQGRKWSAQAILLDQEAGCDRLIDDGWSEGEVLLVPRA
jgi:hypothetical protein